jgi:hypothetical protein
MTKAHIKNHNYSAKAAAITEVFNHITKQEKEPAHCYRKLKWIYDILKQHYLLTMENNSISYMLV